jgi:hypothetical protein
LDQSVFVIVAFWVIVVPATALLAGGGCLLLSAFLAT